VSVCSRTTPFTGPRRTTFHFKPARPAAPVEPIVYARHGRGFMGCKSPVRDWESQGGQYTK
jgi:hypothetical protein